MNVRYWEQSLDGRFRRSVHAISSVALLNENPDPTEDEIQEYLREHLCRCVSYLNIVKAIGAASQTRVKTGEFANGERHHRPRGPSSSSS